VRRWHRFLNGLVCRNSVGFASVACRGGGGGGGGEKWIVDLLLATHASYDHHKPEQVKADRKHTHLAMKVENNPLSSFQGIFEEYGSRIIGNVDIITLVPSC